MEMMKEHSSHLRYRVALLAKRVNRTLQRIQVGKEVGEAVAHANGGRAKRVRVMGRCLIEG
jgi:hypothetical protein